MESPQLGRNEEVVYQGSEALPMKKLFAAALLALPTIVMSGVAHAQYYNPYANQYRQWNQSFPGYQGGNREYRQQIREMNPYSGAYRQYQQENRRSYGWSQW